ncbi:MAG: acyl carrier protein [Ruminococcaceae bacterium]|jgi:acyl carrier protein|nr:acyl carrier protein [Oscillospiraceae bacterium]
MEDTDMFEKIANYLSRQMDVPVESITNDTTFESLGIDSLDTVEMLMDLEQELNVDLELEEKLSTVGEFVAFVEERIG